MPDVPTFDEIAAVLGDTPELHGAGVDPANLGVQTVTFANGATQIVHVTSLEVQAQEERDRKRTERYARYHARKQATPEAREEYLRRRREAAAAKRNTMSPEELEAARKLNAQRQKEWRQRQGLQK